MIVLLNLPAGEKQSEFLDYLNSGLRARVTAQSGSAGRLPDGRFQSTLVGDFSFGASRVPLTWRLIRAAADGSVEMLEVVGAEGAPPEAEWQVAALEFVNAVLTATIASRRSFHFRRVLFYYVGAQLDGEYWLPGFRFAPIVPDDEQPFLANAERVVVLDMNISAVDDHHATSLAVEAARRHAARLSLLLDHGLYRPDQSIRWAIPRTGFEAASQSQRAFLMYIPPGPPVTVMPEKGRICPPGEYKGSLTARYRSASTRLSLPPEARRILRHIDAASPELRLAFDGGARLYQVGLVISSQFPSAGLAYRVAALDAISQANGTKKTLSDFVKRYVVPKPDDSLIDYLWGSIRSAHFHGGEFPMGEFSPMRYLDPLMDSMETSQDQLHRYCYQLAREAIVRWMDSELARSGMTEDSADSDSVGDA